jgi:hypothetical protein
LLFAKPGLLLADNDGGGAQKALALRPPRYALAHDNPSSTPFDR